MAERINIEITTTAGTVTVAGPVFTTAPKPNQLTLEDCGFARIAVIKVIRSSTGWDLRESKSATDELPYTFHAHDLNGGNIDRFRADLEEAGATVGVDDHARARYLIKSLLEVVSDHVK